nr:MAG TPA: Protein of unknown function (DUF2556) [Caudoviricetes sp.]
MFTSFLNLCFTVCHQGLRKYWWFFCIYYFDMKNQKK